jgi:hypothetical protein
MPGPTSASLKTVQNWLGNTGSISLQETEYLNRGELTLLNIGYFKDVSMVRITTMIEPLIRWFYKVNRPV